MTLGELKKTFECFDDDLEVKYDVEKQCIVVLQVVCLLEREDNEEE